MDLSRLRQIDDYCWTAPPAAGETRGPVLLYGSAPLLATMDDKVIEQITNVARLPGLVGAARLGAQTALQTALHDEPVASHWIYDDFGKAVAQARAAGKPILALLRCVP